MKKQPPEYYRKRYKEDPEKHKEKVRKWNESNPEKRTAHMRLNAQISSGKMKRAKCEVCEADKVDAHHDDYSKPLEVRWFCRRHHKAHHLTNLTSNN